MSYQVSVTIHAPAELVWAELIDVERWPRSTASITSVRRLESGPFGVGSRARVDQPRLPPLVWTVTDVQPPREFTWVVSAPGVTTVAIHRLTPAPDDSVTLTLAIERTGLLGPLVDRLTDGLTRRYMTMEAAGMKRVCEASAAALPNVNRFSYSEANY
jgi:uncharacterized membrane protein